MGRGGTPRSWSIANRVGGQGVPSSITRRAIGLVLPRRNFDYRKGFMGGLSIDLVDRQAVARGGRDKSARSACRAVVEKLNTIAAPAQARGCSGVSRTATRLPTTWIGLARRAIAGLRSCRSARKPVGDDEESESGTS